MIIVFKRIYSVTAGGKKPMIHSSYSHR